LARILGEQAGSSIDRDLEGQERALALLQAFEFDCDPGGVSPFPVAWCRRGIQGIYREFNGA
jgi:hypothetical protein